MKFAAILTATAISTALMLAPAAAKSKKHRQHQQYGQSYEDGWNNGGWHGGWTTRNVSDPSYVSPNYRRAQALGRCVEDLGYGRFEYCGW